MLQKQVATFTFSKGLSLKEDPNLIQIGSFLSLQNSIFDTLGQLRKRNGFGQLSSTIGSISYLTSFQGNLIGLGSNIQSYSNALSQFIPKSAIPQISLSVTPIENTLYGYTQVDSAISTNGLICAVSTQIGAAPLIAASIPLAWTYSIIEQATGQLVSGPNAIVASGGYQLYSPRVFSVGSSFVVVYDSHSPVTANSVSFLNYISIPSTSPFTPSPVQTISSNCSLMSNNSFDGAVASQSTLFLSWYFNNYTSVSGATLGPPGLTRGPILLLSTNPYGSYLSVAADTTGLGNQVWLATVGSSFIGIGSVTYQTYNLSGTTLGGPFATNGSGTIILSVSSVPTVANVSMIAQNGSMTSYVELKSAYQYDTLVPTNLVYKQTINSANGGNTSLPVQVARGIGLGSKAFVYNSTSYFLGSYQSPYQSTYFLLNSTGSVQAKLAYGNGGGYLTTGLPSVSVVGSSAFIPYLIKNTISPFGNLTNVSSQTGIYGKLGINIAQFNFGPLDFSTKEIGQNLLLNGGFLGSYDGYQFTENNFFLFPDSVKVTTSNTGGTLQAQQYFYVSTYEWTDNKGNIFRSAPSIPVGVIAIGSSSSNTINTPSLRLSYKNWPYGGLNTPIKISTYRWSAAQPIYYLIQSYTQDTTITTQDENQFIDGIPDNQILGNQIVYTNGGVVEDVNGPACTCMTTFDSRLWLIAAEDQNLLWFSKQVIESTPVEMSDLFTFYVAPNIGAEGPTGTVKCLAPMDDKLIIFKQSAIYYINGIGPDNTGANNQYSAPIFITSAVGCSNLSSIVLIPSGLMFQSDKGIWLLGRDLSTNYIGQSVETLTKNATVVSAITIPGTNQVRFTLNTGITLLYDYFVNQWGTFNGIPGISSTLYQNLHTFVNSSSSIFQETPGIYQDGLIPTTMAWQTGWIGLSGLQGYQRAYRAYLLGTYLTPHNFKLGIAYDYNPSTIQTAIVNPTNTTGSGSQVEQWRINFGTQSCQSFQLTFNEVSSQSAGQGLTMTGVELVYGVQKQFPRNLGAGNETS